MWGGGGPHRLDAPQNQGGGSITLSEYPTPAQSDAGSDRDTLAAIGIEAASMVALEAGLARERTREALFGAAERALQVDRFRVLERVGAGAMGVVYAAYDPDLDRRIALKLLHAGAPTHGTRARMLAEARALARLSHPHVVAVFEVGVCGDDDQTVFLAMEYVRGRTLRAWREQVQPDWRAIVQAYAQAARGLAAVHRAGLVHRDFKPDNAMIDDDGRVRVMDFGLARDDPTGAATLADASSSTSVATPSLLTRSGALVGTPAYMAPELFDGAPADARSDAWAFCVSLYEALWGHRPHRAATPEALVGALMSRAPTPAPSARVGVPRRIVAAIMRGLSPTPADRWQSLDALAEVLEDRSRGRARAVAWLAAAGALAIGAVALQARTRAQACQGSAMAFAEAWNDGRAAQVREAFAATSASWSARAGEDASEALARYGERWVEEHRAACVAARVDHTQSDAMLDRRMRCLEDRRRDFVALVEALRGVDDDALEHVEPAIRGLVQPQQCGDAAYLEGAVVSPPPPAVADAVEALRTQLADIRAMYELGRSVQARARVAGVVEAAQQIGYPPLVAEANLGVGSVELALDDLDAARPHLEQAYFVARTVVDHRTAAGAAMELASLTGTHTDELALAQQWLRLSAVELDDSFEARAELDGLEIAVLTREGRLEDALAAAQRLLVRAEAACPRGCEALADAHQELSRLYDHLGRGREAEPHALAALAQESALHDHDHPHLARAHYVLGELLDSVGRHAESHEQLIVALQMRERMLGVDHPETAMSRVRLSTTLLALGRGDEAVQQATRAVASVRGRSEPLLLAAALSELGGIHGDLHHYAEARTAYEEALTLERGVHPDGDPNQAIVISNLARVASQQGDHVAALAGFEQALAMRRAHVSGYDPLQSVFLTNAGRTLLDLGRNVEALARLREALALSRDEEISRHTVMAAGLAAAALRPEDPAAAQALIAEVRGRCDAAAAAVRAAAGCERLGEGE